MPLTRTFRVWKQAWGGGGCPTGLKTPGFFPNPGLPSFTPTPTPAGPQESALPRQAHKCPRQVEGPPPPWHRGSTRVMKAAQNVPASAILSMWMFNVTASRRRRRNAVLIISFPCWVTSAIKLAILSPAPGWQPPEPRQKRQLLFKS